MRHAFIAASLLAGLAAPAMARVARPKSPGCRRSDRQELRSILQWQKRQRHGGLVYRGRGVRRAFRDNSRADGDRGVLPSRFAAGAAGHLTKILEVHPYGDGGYGVGQFSATVPTPNGERREVHGNIVALYKHDGNTWRMRLLVPQFAPPAPAPMKTTN